MNTGYLKTNRANIIDIKLTCFSVDKTKVHSFLLIP